jgi:hypothetical protein
LNSSFLIAWVSPAYLASPRGWVWIEFAYAELIELSLNLPYLDRERPYILPIFRNVSLAQVERTPFLRYWQRKLFLPDHDPSIPEIARKLVDLYEQEGAGRGTSTS